MKIRGNLSAISNHTHNNEIKQNLVIFEDRLLIANKNSILVIDISEYLKQLNDES